jgi:methionyl-tRNA formyltransferase
MIPAELEASLLSLPNADSCRIVVITGSELRHDRFALRLQAEFPELVVAWLQIGRPHVPVATRPGKGRRSPASRNMLASMTAFGSRMRNSLKARLARRATAPTTGPRPTQDIVEQRMFGDEIDVLKKLSYISPQAVRDSNSAETIALVKALDPYFILTLGGAIYGKELRDCARGLALNQHDGWCPEYRGSNTVDWALYHRDLPKVSNTIHILTDGMDSGPIMRRSSACLAVDDCPESCFARSVALGTELMCEVVRELIQTKMARIFPQPQFSGFTYRRKDMTNNVRKAIRKDLQERMIRTDLFRRTRF